MFRLTILCSAFAGLLGSAAAWADDFGAPIKDFPARMGKALHATKDRTKIELVNCIEGGSEKRTVCTYKLDEYMVAMAAGAAGETQLSDLTLICTPHRPEDAYRCMGAYGASFAAYEPGITFDDRGAILGTLLKGIAAADAVKVTKDNHVFILQHVAGAVWFHLEANE